MANHPSAAALSNLTMLAYELSKATDAVGVDQAAKAISQSLSVEHRQRLTALLRAVSSVDEA